MYMIPPFARFLIALGSSMSTDRHQAIICIVDDLLLIVKWWLFYSNHDALSCWLCVLESRSQLPEHLRSYCLFIDWHIIIRLTVNGKHATSGVLFSADE